MQEQTKQQPSTQQAWWMEPTRDQWAAFLAAWSGWVLDAFDFTVYFLAAPYIAKDFGVSTTAVLGSLTLTLLVRLVGGVVAGAMADRWGRKLPLMISILWFAACDGAVAFAPSFFWVLVIRSIFGFGMGAEWTAGTTLAMETWPERSRHIASGILQGSWAIGYLLASLVSRAVIPAWGWRGLFIVAAAPALIVLPIRIWVKESDEWKKQKATKPKESYRDLLQPELLKSLAWGSGVMALGFGVYYALVSPYSLMLAAEHQFGPAEIGNHAALFNVGMLCGAIITGSLALKAGVRWVIIAPSVLMLPLLPLYVGRVDGWMELGAFLGGMVGVGFTGVTPILLTRLFPTHVRARCIGFVYHAGAFMVAFVPPGIPWLAEKMGWPLSTAIAVSAGTFFVLLIASLIKPRELEAPVVAQVNS